jgi:hypothetical protein
MVTTQAQTPDWQIPDGQTLPHVPQLLGSLSKGTQTPLGQTVYSAYRQEAEQTPLTQLPLRQSPFTPQCKPAWHAGHDPPPQSLSVSLPFLMPSVQVAIVMQIPLLHVWFAAQAMPQPPQLFRSNP